MKRVLIVAGDLSGDFHGANLAKAIKKINPQIEIYSAGGKYLASESSQLVNLTRIAVTGIFEVLRYLPAIFQSFNIITTRVKELKPDLIILIDFPDFNLRLAKKLKHPELTLFYYISPQVWAWRKKRINIIRETINKMLVIFPFEKDFYLKEGIDSIYVGHPLIEELKPYFSNRTPLQSGRTKQIAFLPGSRENEVKRHLPVMIETKKRLQNLNLKFILIKHPHLPAGLFKEAERTGIDIYDQDKYKHLSETDIAVSSSGTATLELALMNIPTVVIYKTNFLSWLILKTLVKIDFISIVNILGKEEIFPELVQSKATSQNISSICKKFLEDEPYLRQTKQKLEKIKDTLGKESAPRKAAQEIVNWLY